MSHYIPVKAIIIKPDGTVRLMEGEEYPLTKDALDGGYLEVVYLDDGSHAYVDEDGLRKELPHNELASFIARRPIVGTMVCFGGVDDEGDSLSIGEVFIAKAFRLAAAMGKF